MTAKEALKISKENSQVAFDNIINLIESRAKNGFTNLQLDYFPGGIGIDDMLFNLGYSTSFYSGPEKTIYFISWSDPR